MSWFEDLTPYTYAHGKSTSPPTLNVGWLACDRDYRRGDVPAAFVERLAELVEHAQTLVTCGMHHCDLCLSSDGDSRPWGNAEIRVVGADGVRFAAPSLVHHYVTVHRYQPPVVFIAAVMRTAHLARVDAHTHDLCLGCGLALERMQTTKAVRNGSLESVLLVSMRCDRCAAEYERTFDP